MQSFWIVFRLHLSTGVPVIGVSVYLYTWMFAWATVFVLTLVCIYLCVGVRASIQVGTLKKLSLFFQNKKNSPSKMSAVGGEPEALRGCG